MSTSAAIQTPPNGHQAILLVEDEEVDAQIFRRALTRGIHSPFRLEHVGTLGDALSRIEAGDLDLVVLDLSLPDSQGVRTYESIRSQAPWIPIVVLTGQSDLDTALDLIHRGAQDFLVKDEITEHNLARCCECAVERMRLQRELEAARQSALVASQAKSAFVSTMSHEIRTPLNAILGMAELLSETPLSSDQREYVQIFRRCGRTLLALLNNVLDLAKLEAGKLQLAEREFDPHALAQDALETFAFHAHSRGLAMICDVGDDVPRSARSDPMRLGQVLFNLVGNAVKFTESGRVILRLGCSADEGGRRKLRFEVSDTGPGIPSNRLEAIFGLFEQADAEVSRSHGGTGLGLALCLELVHLMGGEIQATSEVGKGSSFCFWVPLRGAVEKASESSVDLCGRRVLLVGNDPVERGTLAETLRGWSAEVLEAHSAEEARGLLCAWAEQGRPFDDAVLDGRMPVEGGLGVARWLRGPEAPPQRPGVVALLPMNHRASDAELCRELGATMLLKPVRRHALAEALSGNRGPGSVPGPSSAPRLEGRTVLLAEDSADNQLLVTRLLSRTGCRVEVAVNGVEAVDKWRSLRPDLVLMDVRMPKLDGLEATRRIRQAEREEGAVRTPLVALTADAFEEQGRECLAAGCDVHVSKPVAAESFFELIGGLLAAPAAASPAGAAPAPIEIAVPEEFADLAPAYLERRRAELPELRDSIQAPDFTRLRTLGHNMKGSGRGYGFPDLTRIGAGLQAAAEARDGDTALRLVEELEHYLDRAEPLLRAGAATGSPGTPAP